MQNTSLVYVPKVLDKISNAIEEIYEAKADDGVIDRGEALKITIAFLGICYLFMTRKFLKGFLSEIENLTEEQKLAEAERFKENFDLPDDEAEENWEKAFSKLIMLHEFLSF